MACLRCVPGVAVLGLLLALLGVEPSLPCGDCRFDRPQKAAMQFKCDWAHFIAQPGR